jgi:restriction endonuclease S subunit
MTQKNLEMQQRINSLEAIAAIKDDLSRSLDEANKLIEKLQASKEKMQRELETASDYLLEQEEKTHKSNQTALELLK